MENEDYPAMGLLINSELIYQHFGQWPIFAHFEVSKAIFETHTTGRSSVTFTLTHERDCQLQIQFSGIQEMIFENFRGQNVLHELLFEEQGSLIKATFISDSGLKAMIVADESIVLSLSAN
ncbi:hypothetical protein Q3A66_18740 [Hymenobacter sp. BT770]|uniref:hypothetical protein n=1 Tax=Hymenobacter sp. BT770 TaxID=2886942 RepID=UPI001D12C57C|nr:hypothetical protein [Hymenobacter sp. BT770]MCC3152000.1 hypothetical protein [Hymenobacter sp. BT770]MDO3417110.1 hypothetical protein [Hymenobacter sp. BT770]